MPFAAIRKSYVSGTVKHMIKQTAGFCW